MRILLVEDEQAIADSLKRGLENHSYTIDVAYEGEAALEFHRLNSYDVILLDLNLPRIDGLEICRRIRAAKTEVAIIMITARDRVDDRVTGLDEGADDYLVKPFAFKELLARIRAVLRRRDETHSPILQVADLTLDPASQQVQRSGREIILNRKEFAILEYLLRNRGRVISQEELIEHIWGEDADWFTNTVKVQIMNLRKKINAGATEPLITTLSGRGYKL